MTLVAAMPPTVTPAPERKFEPEIDTDVPPAAGPEVGVIEEIVGEAPSVTVDETEDVLFVGAESGSFPTMPETFVTVPAAVGFTTTLSVVDPARLPTEHVTVPQLWTHPGEADTNVALGGRTSVTVTPVAAPAQDTQLTVSV